MTLARPATPPAPTAQTKLPVIDCDIHNAPATDAALYPYLSTRWQRHLEVIGPRACPGYLYPKGAPFAARRDARPPCGGPPGSNLAFMQHQLLDACHLEYGILNPLFGAASDLNAEYAAAMASALNDWQHAEWLEPEPRLRASIVVPFDHPAAAAAEIDRLSSNPGFVQVLGTVRTSQPLGRRAYWPIYEAAARHSLPVALHFGGAGGNPLTPSGWPSYYIEDHTSMMLAFQAQLVSLICEGVFAHFPTLRVVLIEGGFAWIPPLMWRLDKAWPIFQEEVPWLTHSPSAYIREHVRVSTQPMEEPEHPRHLEEVIAQFGCDDMLLFATDYPHWDFDEPDRALPGTLPRALARKILADNARALYRALA